MWSAVVATRSYEFGPDGQLPLAQICRYLESARAKVIQKHIIPLMDGFRGALRAQKFVIHQNENSTLCPELHLIARIARTTARSIVVQQLITPTRDGSKPIVECIASVVVFDPTQAKAIVLSDKLRKALEDLISQLPPYAPTYEFPSAGDSFETVSADTASFYATETIQFSHIDMNRHVNQANYAMWMENLFLAVALNHTSGFSARDPTLTERVRSLLQKPLLSFSIEYNSEVFFSEKVRVAMEPMWNRTRMDVLGLRFSVYKLLEEEDGGGKMKEACRGTLLLDPEVKELHSRL